MALPALLVLAALVLGTDVRTATAAAAAGVDGGPDGAGDIESFNDRDGVQADSDVAEVVGDVDGRQPPLNDLRSAGSDVEHPFGPDIKVQGHYAINVKTGQRFHVHNLYEPGATDSHGHTPAEHSSTVLLILFTCLVGAQLLLTWWKNTHPRSYQLATLGGLWLMPFVLSIRPFWIRFLLIWTLVSAVTILVMRMASQKPLDSMTPKRVYRFFHTMYHGCYIITLFGYTLLMCQIFGMFLFLGTDTALLVMFYGLYFGVLSRDCAEMCADRMASSMGYTAHEKDRGLPSVKVRSNVCAICNLQLLKSVRADDPTENEKPFKLNCGHQFHEFCLRGWTMIGKKDMCPRCSEKVSLSKIFHSPWEKYGIAWAYVLNALRYLIVWNPAIFFVVRTVLNSMGYGADDEMPEAKPMLIPIQ